MTRSFLWPNARAQLFVNAKRAEFASAVAEAIVSIDLLVSNGSRKPTEKICSGGARIFDGKRVSLVKMECGQQLLKGRRIHLRFMWDSVILFGFELK